MPFAPKLSGRIGCGEFDLPYSPGADFAAYARRPKRRRNRFYVFGVTITFSLIGAESQGYGVGLFVWRRH